MQYNEEHYKTVLGIAHKMWPRNMDKAAEATHRLLGNRARFEFLARGPERKIRKALANSDRGARRRAATRLYHERAKGYSTTRPVPTPLQELEARESEALVGHHINSSSPETRAVFDLWSKGVGWRAIEQSTGVRKDKGMRLVRELRENCTQALRGFGLWIASILPTRHHRGRTVPSQSYLRIACLLGVALATVGAISATTRKGIVGGHALLKTVGAELQQATVSQETAPDDHARTTTTEVRDSVEAKSIVDGTHTAHSDTARLFSRSGIGPRAICVVGSELIVADYDLGALYRLDANGGVLAAAATDLYLAQVVVFGGNLVGLSPMGKLGVFSLESLSLLQTVDLPDHQAPHNWTVDGLAVFDNHLLVTSGVTGAMYELDEQFRVLGSSPVPMVPTLIAAGGREVFANVHHDGGAQVSVLCKRGGEWIEESTFRVEGDVNSLARLNDGSLILAFEATRAVRFIRSGCNWTPCDVYLYPPGVRVNRASVDEATETLWLTTQPPACGLLQLDISQAR